jgi:hypothetical protein
MRYILLALIIPFFGFKKDNGQPDKPCVFISADKMNILYIGIDNPITVSVNGLSNDRIIVDLDGERDKLTKIDFDRYFISLYNSVRSRTLTVKGIMPGNKIEKLGEMKFSVREIIHPEVSFGYSNETELYLTQIQWISNVVARIDDGFPIEGIQFFVTGYTMIICHTNGGNYIEEVNSNKITEGIRKEFMTLKPGDYITAANVKVSGPEGNLVLSGPTIKVKY